ncbi:MAG: FAD binding domain-containing protein [Clostridia bacterium]|nr:FAD binding domain-containing protein [Clostridia bacterium]
MLQIKRYVRATSLAEAYELNRKKSNCILGGGVWLRLSNRRIDTAIDLSDLGLDQIEESEGEFSIGCMATIRQIERHEGLNAYTSGAVRDAVQDIVGVQLRNMATVGGSLFGRFGFSDLLTVFCALDSYVELYQGGIISLREFANKPYDRDILVRLIVKKTPLACAFACVRNTRTDFSVLNCAVSVQGNRALAVVGARPMKAACYEGELDESFPERVASSLSFGSNLRGSEAYRRKLCAVLVRRALEKAGGKR